MATEPAVRKLGRHSGRAAAITGSIGALVLLAGCTGTDGAVDYARACATLERDPIVVPDAYCESTNPRAADQWGWYYVQVPATEYGTDDDGWSYPLDNDTDVVFVAVGQPLSRSTAGGRPASTTRVLPRGTNPARVVSAGAGRAGQPSVVSRGGLGVSSKSSSVTGGSSAGGKAGGSAGS